MYFRKLYWLIWWSPNLICLGFILQVSTTILLLILFGLLKAASYLVLHITIFVPVRVNFFLFLSCIVFQIPIIIHLTWFTFSLDLSFQNRLPSSTFFQQIRDPQHAIMREIWMEFLIKCNDACDWRFLMLGSVKTKLLILCDINMRRFGV